MLTNRKPDLRSRRCDRITIISLASALLIHGAFAAVVIWKFPQIIAPSYRITEEKNAGSEMRVEQSHADEVMEKLDHEEAPPVIEQRAENEERAESRGEMIEQSKTLAALNPGFIPLGETETSEVIGTTENPMAVAEKMKISHGLPTQSSEQSTGQSESPLPTGNNRPPIYPAESRRKGEHGQMLLDVQVLVNGSVGTIEIAESSGYKSLDQAAIDAVKTWRFTPAKENGNIVASIARIPFRFEMK